jgi:AbiV family abortive infection protein
MASGFGDNLIVYPSDEIEDRQEVAAQFARDWWKALMGNACALVEDAAVLAEHDSPGRAQALLVLAMEELAKARWIYQAAEWEWSASIGLYGQDPRDPRDVVVPYQLSIRRPRHAEKLAAAEQYAAGLGGFWHTDRRSEYYFPADLASFEAAAKRRNLDKQAGFYVDREGDRLLSPLAIPAGEVGEFLIHGAQCVEMHLIEDHTRQQDASDSTLIDSVQHLHWVILPFAHPDDFAAFVARMSGQTGERGDDGPVPQ